MSKKFKSLLALFALAFLFIASTSVMAQRDRAQLTQDRDEGRGNVATLGCCRCLGGSNSLDLSTITSNSWTVNGSPVAFLTTIHPLWDLPTGGANWVSTVSTGGTGNVNSGPYEYKFRFVVPACTIEQRVTLTGNYGGDDDVTGVFLDNVTGPTTTLASCSGGWCFNVANNSNPRTFTTNVAPGTYVLRVKILNSGGPSGMFVHAKLTSTCRN